MENVLGRWGHRGTVTKLERRKDWWMENRKGLWWEERNETSEGNK